MNERNLLFMKTWLLEKKADCLRCQERLRAEGRQDEAVFQRIRANVFELSAAVLGAAEKQVDPAAFFVQRMEQIPSNWQTAREKALAHGDTVQAHLEKIKLETAEEIRAAFRQRRSEEND